MKLLFLDIDGCLNNSASAFLRESNTCSEAEFEHLSEKHFIIEESLKTVDVTAVRLVNRLLKDSGAKLVIISTHKELFDSISELARYLHALGLEFAELDKTTGTFIRGEQVNQYIKNQEQDVEYVVIDDSADYFSTQALVKVDAHVGITYADFVKASGILGIDRSTLIIP